MSDVEDWSVLRNRFTEDRNVSRNWAGQTEWPRALWVLKARLVNQKHGLC